MQVSIKKSLTIIFLAVTLTACGSGSDSTFTGGSFVLPPNDAQGLYDGGPLPDDYAGTDPGQKFGSSQVASNGIAATVIILDDDPNLRFYSDNLYANYNVEDQTTVGSGTFTVYSSDSEPDSDKAGYHAIATVTSAELIFEYDESDETLLEQKTLVLTLDLEAVEGGKKYGENNRQNAHHFCLNRIRWCRV